MGGRSDGWPVSATKEQIDWISGVLEASSKPSNALDPLCGAGQVLYECGLRGWKCTGMEPDPFLRWMSTVRSFRFRPDAAEFVGYAWERVADDVFWESDMFAVPEVAGTIGYGPVTADFLGRVRRQIDKESDEGINSLLKLAFLASLPLLEGDDSSFDDRKGMSVFSECLQRVRSDLGPNPELSQTVHLCNPRDMPYTLRNSYDLVVCMLPDIGEREDSRLFRAMGQWMGFGDLELRDDRSIGYPLGDFGAYMSRAGKEDYVERWFSDVGSLIAMLSKVMSRSCTAHFLVPDETFGGISIDRAGRIADMASSMGLEAEETGKGTSRGVAFRRRQ